MFVPMETEPWLINDSFKMSYNVEIPKTRHHHKRNRHVDDIERLQ